MQNNGVTRKKLVQLLELYDSSLTVQVRVRVLCFNGISTFVGYLMPKLYF